jgi:hypothetical protein
LIVGILSQIAADHDKNMRVRGVRGGDGGVMAGVSSGLLTLVGGVPARLRAVLSATMATTACQQQNAGASALGLVYAATAFKLALWSSVVSWTR